MKQIECISESGKRCGVVNEAWHENHNNSWEIKDLTMPTYLSSVTEHVGDFLFYAQRMQQAVGEVL